MFRYVFAIALALSLTACTTVNNQQISQESLNKLDSKSVASARHEPPSFSALTPGKGAFAMFGAAASISAGNKIVKENAIEDPAIAISASLQDKLVVAKHMTTVASTGVAAKNDIDTVLAASPRSDFVLDVETQNWMFVYYATKWGSYRVIYNARLRLIDAANKSVIAESACNVGKDDEENPPTEDQLLENQAALLKDYLRKAASYCSDLFARDVLKL